MDYKHIAGDVFILMPVLTNYFIQENKYAIWNNIYSLVCKCCLLILYSIHLILYKLYTFYVARKILHSKLCKRIFSLKFILNWIRIAPIPPFPIWSPARFPSSNTSHAPHTVIWKPLLISLLLLSYTNICICMHKYINTNCCVCFCVCLCTISGLTTLYWTASKGLIIGRCQFSFSKQSLCACSSLSTGGPLWNFPLPC